MSKQQRKSPLIGSPNGFERPSHAPLPPDTRELGWERTPTGRAERRDASRQITAFVDLDLTYDASGARIQIWRGYSLAPRRDTRDHFLTAAEAIRAVQHAEALGPLSDRWEGQDGPPEREGWDYQVRQHRGVWSRRSADGVPIIVLQVPAAPSKGLQSLRYVASIDGHFLTDRDGTTRLYLNPISAMESAERNAIRQGHTLAPVSTSHILAVS